MVHGPLASVLPAQAAVYDRRVLKMKPFGAHGAPLQRPGHGGFAPAGADLKRHVAPCSLALNRRKSGLEWAKIAILECILGLICA